MAGKLHLILKKLTKFAMFVRPTAIEILGKEVRGMLMVVSIRSSQRGLQDGWTRASQPNGFSSLICLPLALKIN